MRLLLNGGGSGEQIVSAIEKLNEIIDHNKPLLYVPLAMDESEHPNYDDCYEWISGQLRNISIPSIDMTRTFEELASKNMDDYSAIFIGGGNTYKLLKGLKESGAFDKIKEYVINDGVVFGGSAGSVIFGKDINIIATMDPNDVELNDTIGFNCLNGVSIFPHYTNKKSSLTEEQNIERHNKFTKAIIDFSLSVGPVIAYPEEDTLFINGDSVEMIGDRDYFLINEGNIVNYQSTDNKEMDNLKIIK